MKKFYKQNEEEGAVSEVLANEESNAILEFTEDTSPEEIPVFETGDEDMEKNRGDEILEEVKQLRSENVKHYIKRNGGYQAVIFSEPRHYLDQESQTYQEFDSNLEETEDGEIRNRHGKFLARFNKKSSDSSVFCMEKGIHKIEVLHNDDLVTKNNVNSNTKNRMFQMRNKECRGEIHENQKNKFIYRNFINNGDLEYIIENNRVKENIIIHTRSARYDFGFIIKMSNLKMDVASDGKSIRFTSVSDKKEVFHIPSPVMMDSNDAESVDVIYEIEKIHDDEYSFNIIADASWVNDEKRVFPVTIDPQVIVSGAEIIQLSGFEFDQSSLLVGKYNGVTHNLEMALNYDIFSEISRENTRIVHANIKLKKKAETRAGTSKGYEVLNDDKIVGFFRICNTNNEYDVDFTRELITSINAQADGFCGSFKIRRIETEDAKDDYFTIYKNGSAYEPVVTVDYIHSNIMEHRSSILSAACKRAGTLHTNLCSGRKLFEHIDILASTSGLPLNITHIYNPVNAKENSLFGQNWGLNIDQSLSKNITQQVETEEGKISRYTDGYGDSYDFVEKFYYIKEGKKIFVKEKDCSKRREDDYTYIDNKGVEHIVFHSAFNDNGAMLVADFNTDFDDKVEDFLSREYEIGYYYMYNNIKTTGVNIINNRINVRCGSFVVNGRNYTISLEETYLGVGGKRYYKYGTAEKEVTEITEAFEIYWHGSRPYFKMCCGYEKLSPRRRVAVNQSSPTSIFTTTCVPPDNPIKTPTNSSRIELVNGMKSTMNHRVPELQIKEIHSPLGTAIYKEIEVFKENEKISDFLPFMFRTEELLNNENQLIQLNETLYDLEQRRIENDNITTELQARALINSYQRDYDEKYTKITQIYSSFDSFIIDKKTEANNLTDNNIKYDTDPNSDNRMIHLNYECTRLELEKLSSTEILRKELEDTKETIERLSKEIAISGEQNYLEAVSKNIARINEKIIYYTEMRNKICDAMMSLINSYLKEPIDFMMMPSGLIYGFDCYGKLVEINTGDKVLMKIVYDGEVVVAVENEHQKQISLIYDNGKLINIKDAKGRFTNYSYNDDSQMNRITYEDRTISSYTYYADSENEDKVLLSEVTDQSEYTLEVSTSNKIIHIKTGANCSNGPNSVSKELDRDVQISLFSNYLTKVKDGLSKKSRSYMFDGLGKIVTSCDDESEINENKKLKVSNAIFEKFINKNEHLSVKLCEPNKTALHIVSFEGPQTVNWWLNDKSGLIGVDDSHCADVQQSLKMEGFYNKEMHAKAEFRIGKAPKGNVAFIGVWAKAKSGYVHNPDNNNSEDSLCHDVETSEITQTQSTRNFSFKVTQSYDDDNDYVVKDYNYVFDYHNEEWQLGVIMIKVDPNRPINKMKLTVLLSYNYNINEVYFDAISSGECDYVLTKYDNERNICCIDDGEYITSYEEYYEKQPRRVVKKLIKDSSKKYVSLYNYNQNQQLLRLESPDGIISENVFDDNGNLIMKKTFHKDEPSSCFVEELYSDEMGRTTKEVDSRGILDNSEIATKYNYLDKSNMLDSIEFGNGNKVFYGYDSKNDNLLSITSSSEGEKNEVLREYMHGNITKLTQNDTEYTYKYDGLGRLLQFKISGQEYLINEYSRDDSIHVVKSTNANKEVFIVENDTMNERSTKYKNSISDQNKIVEHKKISDEESVITEFNNGAIERVITKTKDRITYKVGSVLELDKQVIEEELEDKINCTLKVGNQTISKTTSYKYADDYAKTLDSVVVDNSIKQSFKYDKLKRAKSTAIDIENQNLITTSYSYLENGNRTSNYINSMKHIIGCDTKHIKYKYDKNGNIVEIISQGDIINRYKYDSLNRLIREDNKLINQTTTFDYDRSGNIILKTVYGYKLSTALGDGIKHEYHYHESWKDQLSSYNKEECAYDKMGNPTIYRDQTLSWSNGRQLDAFGPVNYKYYADGIRKEKSYDGTTVKYYLDGNKIICEKRNDDVIEYEYGGDALLGFKYRGQLYIYLKNLQGDITHIYDMDGVLCAKYDYDAWGNVVTINYVGDIGDINPFRYRGYYYDVETELYYLQSRYYDPETGRFINADDISYLDPKTINGLNLYAYCGGNPVMRIDYSGFFFIATLGLVLIAFLLVADSPSTVENAATNKYQDRINIVTNENNFIYDGGYTINVLVTPGNIRIENSYKITSSADRKAIIRIIQQSEIYINYRDAGHFQRTKESYLEEWSAHNAAYRLHFLLKNFSDYDVDRVKSVDLNDDYKGDSYYELYKWFGWWPW